MKNLHEHLRALEQAKPMQTALVECDISGNIINEITRTELVAKIGESARFLQSIGLVKGDKVALDYANSSELLTVSWAAWACGIITVPLDTKRDTDELRAYKMKASGAKLLITQETFPKSKDIANDVVWMPDLSHEALILFTSGTTAYPKGARLTLQNLVVNAESIVEWLQIKEDDRFLVELPLHHINSTTFCLASLIAGSSIAIPPRYSNSHFWEQTAQSGATFTSIVPSVVFDQLDRIKEFAAVKDRLKLNRIQLGSAPVVVSDAKEFMKKFYIPLYQGYGQTETALRVTGVPMDLAKEQYEEVVAENSIGTPMKWADVEVVDADERVLGEGQEGELVVKGPAVMQGYIGNEPAFRDGYFLTGDIGYWKEIHGRRFFYLIGRSKEIIIKGGVNISPVAVENILKKIDTDVDQAYVVGVSDKRYGEEVGAVMVWKKDIEIGSAMRKIKLLLLAKNKALSAYETPKWLACANSKDLPTTSTGKVQRIILRKNLESKFESVFKLMHSDDFEFEIISSQSALADASLPLYNHCWQPLIKSDVEYKKYLGEYLTLGAVDKNGALAGQISFSYSDKKITCVSICSASFKPKPIPEVGETPNANFVREYLLAGHDPVMNFHKKLGAELVEVTPGGRSDDKSSIGYTMLLRYPHTSTIEFNGPVSNQLIQAMRILANDVGSEVYAVSRPGGLASYLNRGV